MTTRQRRGTVGPIIKTLRSRAGLTQGQLAEYAHVPRSWLSLVEANYVERPERERLESIANALRVPAETILSAAGYRVARPVPQLPEPPSVDEALHVLHAAIDREKQRPGGVVQILPSPASPALADVLDRLELGAETLMSATRELRHLMTVSERNGRPGRNTQTHEENYLAPGALESATVAGQLAVDMATVLPPELAAAYAHELASLTPDERLAALNALLAYVRDEERRRGSGGRARCPDVPEPGGAPSWTAASDASD